MRTLVVVNNLKNFDFDIPEVEVVTAKTYLTDSAYAELRNVRIYNLCRSYRYQSMGYYVSLLGEARSHKVIPNITTIQDLKSPTIVRAISVDIDDLIQRSLAKIKSHTFVLSIYFGKNVSKHYDALSKQLYNLFQAPLLSATFVYNKKWVLQNISPIPLNDIPERHKPYLIEFSKSYFNQKRIHTFKKPNYLYDLAILVNDEEIAPPSDKKAIKKFITAAESEGFCCELINKDDINRIAEFDALFIRETTSVNHHTYRFSRRAFAEGLVVLDDPISIVKCTNKVYLAELLNKAKVPTPKTVVVHKYNKDTFAEELGYPCILKPPDGSFSQGIVKAKNKQELDEALEELLSHSDLVIAQEFMPTAFDWRVGILDKQIIYVCKYYAAKDHWQIYNWRADESAREGAYETLAIADAPKKVLEKALRAANLIGDGFYGVDLKEIGDKVVVIEVNDNPSIDHGVEDLVLKDDLYLTIIRCLKNRIERSRLPKE